MDVSRVVAFALLVAIGCSCSSAASSDKAEEGAERAGDLEPGMTEAVVRRADFQITLRLDAELVSSDYVGLQLEPGMSSTPVVPMETAVDAGQDVAEAQIAEGV